MIDVPRLLDELGIQARRRGHDYWSRCPLPTHKDGEPSWHITDRPGAADHGSWHCFGCREGGGPIDLVMGRIGTSFPSARSWLVEHGIVSDELPSVDVELVLVDRLPRHAFELPRAVRQVPLAEWPSAAKRYARARGITAVQARRYALGHAPDGRLAGRIVFPFLGEDGRPESYSARTYTGHELRYLTPHRDEGASLDAVFGAHRWPPRGSRAVVIVGEGAINALACERVAPAGTCIAALSGSSPSAGQIERLASFEHILVATDPDNAGEWAAGVIEVLSRWRRVARVEIDKGEDAQSMSAPILADRIDEALGELW